ncbi:hypothetical protein [Alloyangia mangrovi]|uniref:hypothetical protein n=1 Tax=Alloyangia mangrovi TaxID=1779329 RepID=UPI0021A2F41F|nr:hypothetical protein [Alloyangia mangrovi]
MRRSSAAASGAVISRATQPSVCSVTDAPGASARSAAAKSVSARCSPSSIHCPGAVQKAA